MTQAQYKEVAIFSIAVAVAVMIGFGCGDDPLCEDVDCVEGEECLEGICVPAADQPCEPECSDGEVCERGRCVSAAGGCDYQGQPCRAEEHLEWTDNLFCVDWERGTGASAVCSQNCIAEGCPLGSACFGIIPGAVRSCDNNTDCADQEVCYNGQCIVAACRPSECELSGGVDSGCASGQRCGRIEAGFFMCIPAGIRQVGEECIDGATANEENRYGDGCVEEAVCVGGVCQAFCPDGGCQDGTECVEFNLGGADTVEACARSCEVSADGDGCEPNETCVPSGSDGGGLCRPAGSIEAFEPCGVGEDLCEPGTICAEEEGGAGFGRCLPVCDLSAGQPGSDGELGAEAQAARDATCPQPDVDEALWMAWHLAEQGEAVDLYVRGELIGEIGPGEFAEFDDGNHYRIGTTGTLDWAVRFAGDPPTEVPIAEGSVELNAGDSRLLLLMPEPGRDSGLLGQIPLLEELPTTQWVQAIPDLEDVDLWAFDGSEEQLWLHDLGAGQVEPFTPPPGTYDLWLVPNGEGAQGERLVEAEAVGFTGEERFVAFGGTVDPGDIHGVGDPLVETVEVVDVEQRGALAMTCRSVNGGAVGGCMEKCRGLDLGRCQGTSMGCAPRFHRQRSEWTTVCQPLGSAELGEPCDPFAEAACGEGLYCEEYGNTAEHLAESSQRGLCAALCVVSEDGCGDERWCRPLTGTIDYEIGECRKRCEPDGGYEDASCPAGQRSCKPEGRLVPAGDGIGGAYEMEPQQPVCWASGDRQVGEACNQGECVAGSECLFERSIQSGFVETLLSQYFGTGATPPECRPICDPFTEEISDYQCGSGETCLFNYPWNASVGHCTTIAESLSPGDPCQEPGLACGADSICIDDGGIQQCIRFCQFEGQDATGYQQSTCPIGYECGPLVADIGVCR